MLQRKLSGRRLRISNKTPEKQMQNLFSFFKISSIPSTLKIKLALTAYLPRKSLL